MKARKRRIKLISGEKVDIVELSQELVEPENLEKLFLFQDLLGRGLKSWKRSH